MAPATELILKQWGAFGAVLIILGYVIWKLWSNSTMVMTATITSLTADRAALTVALAESNRLRLVDHVTMSTQLIEMTKDNAGGQANSTNAIEAVNAALADTKLTMRDMTEEMRRRRGG